MVSGLNNLNGAKRLNGLNGAERLNGSILYYCLLPIP